jgi:hypothetical protein
MVDPVGTPVARRAHIRHSRKGGRWVADDADADRLYPQVLVDVAARWSWLELSGAYLRRPGAADRYLRAAFARRSQGWQSWWEAENTAGPPACDIQVLRPDRPPPPLSGGVPARSSAAVRQAEYLHPTSRTEVGPLAEASIAWWHAYEAHRRRLLIAALVAALILLLTLLRIGQAIGPAGLA